MPNDNAPGKISREELQIEARKVVRRSLTELQRLTLDHDTRESHIRILNSSILQQLLDSDGF